LTCVPATPGRIQGAKPAVAWPLAARAQQRDRIRHVGLLVFGTVSAWANRIEALRTGLRELGYVEGQNVAIRKSRRLIRAPRWPGR
jgi:hypothetical protein